MNPASSRPIAPLCALSDEKRHGVHYTPEQLAAFVARRAVGALRGDHTTCLTVLDPACGAGELLAAVANAASASGLAAPDLVGVDRDPAAIRLATARLQHVRAESVSLRCGDYLAPTTVPAADTGRYDLVICNPPYVRTQVLGAARSRDLARRFGLTGRVDLQHAFIAAVTARLATGGTLGLICSNRFLSTQAGHSLRSLLLSQYEVAELWDLGDTKLFTAAVLPAVVVARRGSSAPGADGTFVRIHEYSAADSAPPAEESITAALEGDAEGVVEVGDQRYLIERGALSETSAARPWQLRTASSSRWLADLDRRTASRLGDAAPIKVGIKTCADRVFIRRDWSEVPTGPPEDTLLHPLLTASDTQRWTTPDADALSTVLYPHEVHDGHRRPVDLARYPAAAAYLDTHREQLQRRSYVGRAGREWYEIWVPQQPGAWSAPKIVWPDIAEQPRFALDRSGAVVNGCCYWQTAAARSDDELALVLAVANSTVALRWYDECCGNRLYAGRRRFLTQYMRGLPLPRVSASELSEIATMVGRLCDLAAHDSSETAAIEQDVDDAIQTLFGVDAGAAASPSG